MTSKRHGYPRRHPHLFRAESTSGPSCNEYTTESPVASASTAMHDRSVDRRNPHCPAKAPAMEMLANAAMHTGARRG